MTAPQAGNRPKEENEKKSSGNKEKKDRARRLETLNLIRGNKGDRSILATGPQATSRNSSFPLLNK